MEPPILELRSLTMQFGGLAAVIKFSLSLNRGEIVGLIGPNGAGKSTIFNMITGFYQPTSGSILFKQKNLSGLSPDKVAKEGIIRIFQNGRLFKELEVLENLLISQHMLVKSSPLDAIIRTRKYNLEEKKMTEKAEEVLGLLNLQKYKNEKAGKLPYGVQRKLEVARALTSEPQILLLDEPATGLNVEEIDEMMRFVLQIKNQFNLTIMIIEHHMPVVMSLCPRIYVLDHGETIANGTPQEIQANKRVIEAYLGVEEDA